MYFKLKVLAFGPLFKKLNIIALICLLICVDVTYAAKLPLLKRDTSSMYSISSSSANNSTSGLSSGTNQNIEINLGLNNKKLHTEKVPAQSNVVLNCNMEYLQGWYKNGENLNVALKSLTFKSMKKIDSGLYSCKSIGGDWLNVTISVTSNKTHSTKVKSHLDGPNSKKLHFTDTSNMHSLIKKTVGDSVQFHCTIEDAAKLLNVKLTWTKNGKPLNRTGPIYFTKTSLQIEKLLVEDSGQYTCHICNINSCLNFTTTLDIFETGHISQKIDDDDLESKFRKQINSFESSDEYQRDEPISTDLNNNTDSEDDDSKGIILYFVKPDTLENFIAKPSGHTARLQCNVKGYPEPTLTWTKDNKVISRVRGAVKYRRFAIVLEDLISSDSGTYVCKACNDNGCIEHTTRLYVPAKIMMAPLLTKIPENLTLVVGGTGVMKCEDYSESASVRNWFKGKCENCTDTSTLQLILKTDSENLDYLRLNDVTYEDEGWYTCSASNSFGISTSSAYLTVIDGLPVDSIKLPMRGAKIDQFIDNLVADPDSLNNEKNDNEGITNDDDDEDLYLEPEFREPKNKTSLTEPNNYLTENQQGLVNHNTTNLENLNGNEKEEDIHSDLGNKSDDEDDETKGIKPYFSKLDSMDGLVAKPSGNMVRLACNVKGYPEPTLTWTKDDLSINRLMGAAKYRKFALILEDLVPSDSGSYKCKACNEHGCIEHSTKLYVTERFPARPYVKEGFPKNLTVLLNDTAGFECPTVSDLAAHIEWAKFRAQNDNDTNVPVNVQKFQTDSENPEILRLDNVTFEDEGWYTCYAANSLGTSAASAYLAVVAELPVDPIKLPMRGLPVWLLILIIILASSFIIAIGVMCVIFKKLQIEKQNKNLNLEKVNMVTKKIIIVKPNSYNTNGNGTTESISFPIVKIEKHRSVMLQNSNCEQTVESEYEFPIDEDWEIARSKLSLGRPLGEGEFGRVMMAEARDLFKPGSKTIVAVKMLKDGHTDQDVSDLVSEMELMKMIGKHINIINLLGCCTQDGPLHVIVEYAPHGNLRDFLKSNRLSHDNSDPSIQKKCFTEKELVSYAYQAARGMEYLASRRCVHRDLAARNVLVGEDYIIKIADFGLARDIHAQDYYRKNSDGRLPIKWMAPESLMYKKYDSKSDVWSYGILLWEIMSLGATPYPYMAKYTKMITTLQSGYRMEKPEYCSMDIYTLMRECWNFRPDQRPNFSEIVKDLDQILSRTSDKEYLDLGLPELETPPSSENESDTDTEEL